jgi:hypothetical protein
MNEHAKDLPSLDAMVERPTQKPVNPLVFDLSTLASEDLVSLREVIDTLVELLELFGFDSAGYKRRNAVVSWAPHVQKVGWMKWTKYKLAAYFAFHMNQELPKQPTPMKDNPGDLLTGTACRFMRRYLRDASKLQDKVAATLRRLELLNSVLLSKKGMPRPDQAALDKAIKETVATLTTHTEPQRYAEIKVSGGNVKYTFELLKQECKRTVREVFRGEKFSTSTLTRAFMPSMSANYNNTRSKLGTLGMLADEGVLTPLPEFKEVHPDVEELEPVSLGESLRRYGEYQRTLMANPRNAWLPHLSHGEWVAQQGLVVVDEEGIGGMQNFPKGRRYQMTNYSDLDTQFEKVYFRAIKKAYGELPLVEPVALPEALKVRVISKGPPYTYFVLKPVQHHMWGTLKNHPVFQLIGSPVNADVLESVIGATLGDGEAYLSGDYKAATDNLRKELSECVWDEYCRLCEVPDTIWALGRNALTQHYFVDEKTGKPVRQQAGQLMGSIISFPVLCMVNAAVCRKSMEIGEGKSLPLAVRRLARRVDGSGRRPVIWTRVLRLLINGDDCLFPINQTGRFAWKLLSAMAGLEESIGKVYYSTEFANVNSTNYVRVHRESESVEGGYWEFVQTKYVNLGLLKGIKRSGGKAGVLDVDFDLASRLGELIALAPTWIDESLLWKQFRRNNSTALELFTENRIPWFVPKQYGGLGLQPIAGLKTSRQDISIVRTMVNGGLGGRQPVPLRDPVALQLHQYTTALVEACGVVTEPEWVMEKSLDPLDLRPLYLWALFMRPDDVMQGALTSEDQAMELIRHNRRVWSYYTAHLSECMPPWPDGIQQRFLTHHSSISL